MPESRQQLDPHDHRLPPSKRSAALRRAACALVLLVSVAACGGDDGDARATTTVTEAAAMSAAPDQSLAPTDGSAFPVEVPHKFGTTTIPAEPQRVVTIGATDHDIVLSLGVIPVAVSDWRGTPWFPWNSDAVDDAESAVVLPAELNLELVAAQEPDLILALWAGIDQNTYELLTAIAPTVAQSGDYEDYAAPWDVNTRVAAQALGRPADGERVIADTNAALKAVADAHPEFAGRTVVQAYDFGSDGLGAFGDNRSPFFTALGFEYADWAKEAPELSLETLDVIDADVVFWTTLQGSTLRDNPLYQRLPVVQEGRDVFTATNLSMALNFNTPLSLVWLAERLPPVLVAALDGDPATAVEGDLVT